jgi:DNA-binding IclR family transcriptional regulator
MIERSRVATNMRLFYVLDIISQQQRPLTPSEINAELGWPKQTVHRLCKSMVQEGFLTYDATGKRLLPSTKLRTISNGLIASDWNSTAVHQVLERLSEKVQETVNYIVPGQLGMIYKDRVQTNWAFQVHLPVGSHVPFHCTASGKTYLASLPNKARNIIVGSLNLKHLTPNTLSDKTALMAELTNIRKQGYALDNEEFFQGMIAMAVPIHDPQGHYHAALAFHGPTMRLNIEHMLEYNKHLREVANQLSKIIFQVDD